MDMLIPCPGCQATLRGREKYRGKSIRCPRCQTIVKFPEVPAENIGEVEELPEVLPVSVAEASSQQPQQVLPVVNPEQVLPVVTPVEEPRRTNRTSRPNHVPEDISGTAFALAPGERILLRGGFGGKFALIWMGLWIGLPVAVVGTALYGIVIESGWSAASIAVLILAFGFLFFCAIPGLWPLLRSCRYWITSRGLHFKLHLGSPQFIHYSELEGCTFHPGKITRSFHIYGARRIALRYIRDVERLWGALVMFRQIGPLVSAAGNQQEGEVAWWKARRWQGMSPQNGVAILRPDYFAFLPSEKGSDFFESAAEDVVEEIFNINLDEIETKIPFDLLIPVLATDSMQRLDEVTANLVERFHGSEWYPNEVAIVEEEFPHLLHHHAICFVQEADGSKMRVRGIPGVDQWARIRNLIPHWHGDGPLPFRRRLGAGLALAALVTVMALAIAWYGYGEGQKEDNWLAAYGFYGLAIAVGMLSVVLWLLNVWAIARAVFSLFRPARGP